MAVIRAMFSPQPALPRAQMPLISFSRSVSVAAASRMNSQVGSLGISSPASSKRSVRYIVKDDSP